MLRQTTSKNDTFMERVLPTHLGTTVKMAPPATPAIDLKINPVPVVTDHLIHFDHVRRPDPIHLYVRINPFPTCPIIGTPPRDLVRSPPILIETLLSITLNLHHSPEAVHLKNHLGTEIVHFTTELAKICHELETNQIPTQILIDHIRIFLTIVADHPLNPTVSPTLASTIVSTRTLRGFLTNPTEIARIITSNVILLINQTKIGALTLFSHLNKIEKQLNLKTYLTFSLPIRAPKHGKSYPASLATNPIHFTPHSRKSSLQALRLILNLSCT